MRRALWKTKRFKHRGIVGVILYTFKFISENWQIYQGITGKVLYSLVQYWWYLSQEIAAMKLMDARTETIPWKP